MVTQVRGLIALLLLLVLLVGCSGDGAPPLPSVDNDIAIIRQAHSNDLVIISLY